MALADIPFYGAMRQRQAQIRDEGMDELKQVGVLSQLQAQMQAQHEKAAQLQRVQQFAAQLPESERAAFMLDPAGYIKEKNEGFTLTPGAKRFRGGVEVASVPHAPEKVSTPLTNLQAMRVKAVEQYGEAHPFVQQIDRGIAAHAPEIPKLNAPPKRELVQGEETVQQEMQPDGTWKEVGRGPRFAKQIGPTIVNPPAPTVTEIVDPKDPSKSIKIDARTGNKIGDAPRSAAGRPLPAPLQKQLTEAAELADATARFVTSFKDDFGGKTLTGGLSNTAGRILGDDTGQAQWWQDYELHQSQVRNKLFGSALTAPEIAAWNKSAINPRMEAKQIKENLARRDKLEQTAINRLMRGAAVTYNKEQIEAFTGRPIDGTQPAAPTVPAAPTIQEGQTATGRGGQKIIFKGGAWHPL